MSFIFVFTHISNLVFLSNSFVNPTGTKEEIINTVIFKLILMIDIFSIYCEIVFRIMAQDFTDD